MSNSTLREKQRQVREDAILDAAQQLMAEQGYADMSMDDLAARVGVSKATLYQHFPSKEELAILVIVRSMRRGEEFITGLDPALPAIVRLERMMRNALEKRVDVSPTRTMLPVLTVHQHPLYQAQAKRLEQVLAQLIDGAKAEGSISTRFDTPVVVHMVRGIIREIGHGNFFKDHAYEPAQLSSMLIDMVFNGIRNA